MNSCSVPSLILSVVGELEAVGILVSVAGRQSSYNGTDLSWKSLGAVSHRLASGSGWVLGSGCLSLP